jgi:hypothetical protein
VALAVLVEVLMASVGLASDLVAGNLVTFNDNGAWCWFQGERAVIDKENGTLLVSSVACSDGVEGKARTGDVDLASFPLEGGSPERFVLHHNLQRQDDHNSAGVLIRPDGKYVAMYTRHNQSAITYWRVSSSAHEAGEWAEEKTFDWTPHLTPARENVTYSNLFYLSAENRAYDFTRGVNLDPSILVSYDMGDTWTFGGKLLTLDRVGYVNGYVKYASNGVDRIDFITTEHHPRDFNNSVYHGYVQGGKLHRSDGTVVDENVFDNDGKPNTELTPVFLADSKINGELMTHGWIVDIRLDHDGYPCAIISCRANDVPNNTNFNDHRFLYAKFDGSKWNMHELAKAGPRLWNEEQDYTGLAALNPNDCSTVYISAPIDPTTGSTLKKHEIFKGVTKDGGATWAWTAITANSSVDNLRPIIPPWTAGNTAILWFRGTMPRSQLYDCAVVGIIDRKNEEMGSVQYVNVDASNTSKMDGDAKPPANRPTTAMATTGMDRALWKTSVAAPGDGTYEIFVTFHGNPKEDQRIQAGLSEKSLLWFGPLSNQQLEERGLYRASLGRAKVSKGQAVEIILNDRIGAGGVPAAVRSVCFSEVIAR